MPYKLTRDTHPISDVIFNTSQDAIDALVEYIDANIPDCAADLLVIHPLPCWRYREFELDYHFLVLIDKAPIERRQNVAKECAQQKLWRDCRLEVVK